MMVKKILDTQIIDGKVNYKVKWNNSKRKPCWLNADLYPEIDKFVQTTGYSVQLEKNKKQALAKIRSTIKKDSKADMEFFAIKKSNKNMDKRGKRKKQNYAQKLQKEGIQKYKLSYLHRLEKIIDKLAFEIQKPKSSIILDYQVDYIQAVFKTKTDQICFIVNVVGKNQKFSVPLKKMKKHFPRTLKEYLEELVKVNKSNQPEYEQARSKPLQDDSSLYFQSSSAPKNQNIPKEIFQDQSEQRTPIFKTQQNVIANIKGSIIPFQLEEHSQKMQQQLLQPMRQHQQIIQKADELKVTPQQRFLSDIFSEESYNSQE